ncbi:hypothetical protein NA78x_005826 [Anatilimnocola sp. NA78]|uniref:hypothetical protein n=1 Tax=Anatilimnocola sp. NA78 TaxID=3415683 RepID=UPI003CE4A98C
MAGCNLRNIGYYAEFRQEKARAPIRADSRRFAPIRADSRRFAPGTPVALKAGRQIEIYD